jgi:Zn-dependent protease with chaperone function
MTNKFTALWPKSTTKLQAGIAIVSLLGAAAAMATGIGAFAAGTIGLWQLIGAGGIALAMHGVVRVVADSGMAENMIRKLGRPAPAEIRAIAEDIFAKAGLDQKYKPVVLVTDSSLMGRNPKGKHRAMFDCGAFVLPFPVGRDKDTVLIGVGRKALETLDRDELTAVLAHEAGHIINRSPNLNNLYSTTKHLSTGLLATSLLFMNAAALPLAAGGFLATQLLMARGKKFDEERADRTSLSIYPHKTALISALNKLAPMMIQEMYPHGKTPGYYLRKAKSYLFGDHPTIATRALYAEKYYAESRKFHVANDLPASPAAYNTGAAKGPWARFQPDIMRCIPLRADTVRGLRHAWDENGDAAQNAKRLPPPTRHADGPGLNGPV